MSNEKEWEVKINTGWCKACGICISLCPRDVLQADEFGKAQIIYPERCIGCQICEMHCPDFAILVEKEDKRDEADKEKVASGQ